METKEINIAEILRDCPQGTKLYSPAFGDLFLEEVGTERIYTYKDSNNKDWIMFYPDGKYDLKGECSLFPSRDQRDWSKFENPVMPLFEIKRVAENKKFWLLCERINPHETTDVTDFDEECYKNGNYFNTREQAEYAAKKVKELLLSLRKEI